MFDRDILAGSSRFNSPARLRRRSLLAYIRCRRAAKLKMLCIVGIAAIGHESQREPCLPLTDVLLC
jgi:hypothetical protein